MREFQVNLSKSHKSYFNAAKAISEQSKFKQYHIGCVAVYRHKIISSGCNSDRTNPLQKKLNVYRFPEDSKHKVHAEVSCLLPLIGRKDINFHEVSLYIYREHKNGALGIARPCASCMALIRSLGIRYIYYTGEKSYINEDLIY